MSQPETGEVLLPKLFTSDEYLHNHRVGRFRELSERGPSLQLYNGTEFFLFYPEPDKIEISSVAHALANLCRFTGHTRAFYSVAQHSVLVAQELLPLGLSREGILHDATEAFIGDIATPLKIALHLAAPNVLKEIEGGIEKAVEIRFGVDLGGNYDAVKHADWSVLAAEKRDLMDNGKMWVDMPPPPEWTITPWEPKFAYRKFMEAWEEYGG